MEIICKHVYNSIIVKFVLVNILWIKNEKKLSGILFSVTKKKRAVIFDPGH